MDWASERHVSKQVLSSDDALASAMNLVYYRDLSQLHLLEDRHYLSDLIPSRNCVGSLNHVWP